jgi:hypothetical protein
VLDGHPVGAQLSGDRVFGHEVAVEYAKVPADTGVAI